MSRLTSKLSRSAFYDEIYYPGHPINYPARFYSVIYCPVEVQSIVLFFSRRSRRSAMGDRSRVARNWLAGRLGDMYPYETVIIHIRRGLENRFPRSIPGETRARFATCMLKVQQYLNSPEFKARGGGGLAALAESLRERCRRMSLIQDEHLRT